MDAICMLGGVCIGPSGCQILIGAHDCPPSATATAGPLSAAAVLPDRVRIDDADFSAEFDGRHWTVRWKWTDATSLPELTNRVASYRIQPQVRTEFEGEVDEWIRKGWLKPFEGEHVGLIPLMAVVQLNKAKVRPVMDYRELNQFVSSHTADGEVCSAKLRLWRKMGDNLSIIDLRKAYLQVCVDPSLWRYQVVEFRGQRYCLTRLGFGLNVAPKIMSAILQKVLSLDATVRSGTDSFIDDIVVNNDVVSNLRVTGLLEKFGLEAKPPECLVGGRVLGLRVDQENSCLIWRRDNVLTPLQDVMTRRKIFSWCGQLLGHFPVAGWLRPACSYLKRASSGVAWDLPVGPSIMEMVHDCQRHMQDEDPVSGRWSVPLGQGLVRC